MESLANGVIPAVTYFSGFKDGIDGLESYLSSSLIEKMKIANDKNTRIQSIITNINGLLSPAVKPHNQDLHAIAVKHYDWKIRAAQMLSVYHHVFQSHKHY